MTNAATTPTTDAYIPGVCNINTVEIARRRKIGYVGSVIFIVLLAVLVLAGAGRWYRLVLFIPAFLAATGFLQAKNHFCVGYAGAGQQNATEGSDKATTIADAEAVKKDKQRARTMNLQVLAIGIVLTALSLIIPVVHH